MKNPLYPLVVLLIVAALFLFQACMDESQQQENLIPEINEFVFLPANPESKDLVNMVTYDCKYNALASVTVTGKDIVVKKRFNGQLKWPCILYYDTISLGRLYYGTYSVTLLIIDTNPYVKDSISVKETITLKVGK